jgi:hypothetical protein
VELSGPETIASGPATAPPVHREPKGLQGFGIDPADVNRAIDRGRRFLWNYLKDGRITDRRPFGNHRNHLLAALALLHADGVAELPDFDAHLRTLLATAALRTTYEMGLYLMAVRSYGDPAFYPRAAEVAQALVDQQGPEGSWSYGKSLPAVKPKPRAEAGPAAEPAEDAPTVRDGPFAVTGGAPPAPSEAEGLEAPTWSGGPLTRRVPWNEGKNGDNSCTQFALLGLRAAKSMGMAVPAKTWENALAHFRRVQLPEGAFGYTTSGPSGSMTCAGISAIALTRYGLGETGAEQDPAIDRALYWLACRFRPDRNPRKNDWHYYWIYSLERVGRLLDTEFIGPWEWYPLGVRSLLARQGGDGSWVGEGTEKEPEIATSFALLFLTRATEELASKAPPRRPAPPPGPGRLVTVANAPSASRYYFILDASGSMRAWIEGQSRFDLARQSIRDLVAGLPSGAEVALRVYGHRHARNEDAANRDSALELPLAPLDLGKFERTLGRLEARGKTPLAYSLSETAKDIRRIRGPVHVVLLTDGGEEAEPPRDPVAAARELKAAGDVHLTIIGFAIGLPDSQQQLEKMAEAAGGTRRFTRDKAELIESLNAAARAQPAPFTVVDEEGATVGEGVFGDELELASGSYRLRTASADGPVEVEFHVRPGRTVRIAWDPTD